MFENINVEILQSLKYNMCFLFFKVLHETFPKHTFLMNGLIQGVKVCFTIVCLFAHVHTDRYTCITFIYIILYTDCQIPELEVFITI